MEGLQNLKPALFWKAAGKKGVVCELCPRTCIVAEGEYGFCGIRMNSGGRLYAAAYGRPASVAVDPIEKKPLYHFHPGTRTLSLGTIGCNMRCRHCQNCDLSYSKHEKDLLRQTSEMPLDEVIETAKASAASGISFTYNEPTIWFEFVLDCFREAKKEGLYTALVTNAYINPDPLSELLEFTDSYRADLKFIERRTAKAIADIENPGVMLDRIIQAKTGGAHVEIVTNLVPGYNDSQAELKKMAGWITDNLGVETPWHVTRSFPQKHWHVPPTSLDKMREAIHIGHSAGLFHVYPGNVTGFDADTRCPECGEVKIVRSRYRVSVQAGLPHCSRCGRRIAIVT